MKIRANKMIWIHLELYKRLSNISFDQIEENERFIRENKQLAFNLRVALVHKFMDVPDNYHREVFYNNISKVYFNHLKQDFKFGKELLEYRSEIEAYNVLGNILVGCNAEIYCTLESQKDFYNLFPVNEILNIDKILEKYSKAEIIRKCEVSHSTVYNWIKKNNMPMWAIEVLGFKTEK
jgi:hypothetical protein